MRDVTHSDPQKYPGTYNLPQELLFRGLANEIKWGDVEPLLPDAKLSPRKKLRIHDALEMMTPEGRTQKISPVLSAPLTGQGINPVRTVLTQNMLRGNPKPNTQEVYPEFAYNLSRRLKREKTQTKQERKEKMLRRNRHH